MTKKTKRSDRERFNYGICLNDECEMCKDKTIQKIALRKDLVCESCGRELRECPPPKPPKKTWLYVLIALILIGAIVGCIIVFSGNDTPTDPDLGEWPDTTMTEPIVPAKTDTVFVYDTIVRTDTVVVQDVVKPSKPSSNGSLNLSYGTYKGETRNGYPHGQGRLTYSTSRQINKNDMKGRVANKGDYVVGEFYNGFVVYGKHYDANGNLIGSLNFGIGQESSYDSK